MAQAIEKVEILTAKRPRAAIVDKRYQGAEVSGLQILRSGQRRGATKTMRAMIKRRSAIELAIGHMKMDGRLGRNPLKVEVGDAPHAVLCGAGHSIRMLLKKLRFFCVQSAIRWQALLEMIRQPQDSVFLIAS